LPLGIPHGIGELGIVIPTIDIEARLLGNVKPGHERIGILAVYRIPPPRRRPGWQVPLGIPHGVGELGIAIPAIDIGARLLGDAKPGHECIGIPARRGSIVEVIRGRSHDDLLSCPSRDGG
jgi:hypothetical protein